MRKIVYTCDECKAVIESGLIGYDIQNGSDASVIIVQHDGAAQEMPLHACGTGCFGKSMTKAILKAGRMPHAKV